MYRITYYDFSTNTKTVEEFNDEDDMRETVDMCLNDIENKAIRAFTVSTISGKVYEKPFWEKEGS